MDDYFARLDTELAELTRRGAHLEPAVERRPGRFRPFATVAVAASVAVAVAVAAAILLSAKSRPSQPARPAHAAAIPAAVRQLEKQLAVLRRPQTARDRTLPALVRQVIRLNHFGPLFQRILTGSIPSLTRYIETLPDSREVFLVVYSPGARGFPAASRAVDRVADIGLMTIQPDGKWRDGQPLTGGSGGATARSLYFLARQGPDSCSLQTLSNIVPDRVKRIVWQFPRQDSYGYVYKAPETITIPVVNNVAIVTNHARASCDHPTVVTLYGANGQVLSHSGNPATLDHIGRPIRHGKPGPPASLLDGRFRNQRHR